MTALLVALVGFAVLDSLDVLLVGVTAAVVYDARLSRRSPVPGGLGFLAGVFAVTTAFGILTVLGIGFLTDLFDFTLTPTIRYRGELVVGIVLIALAALPVRNSAPPEWTRRLRTNPWVLALAGVVIGLAQAPTAIPYLAGLGLIAAHQPLPPAWPAIVVAYCALALVPPLLILLLATRRTPRSRRRYMAIVRGVNRYGPATVRVIFAVIGVLLVVDSVIHRAHLL
ncbi:hypothetical protein G4H71_08850 [Rhodococcus triatomae]|uniref:Sap, sulfolipid-1-addressing protein n=1 Tax=Rhodococcus triatomae TaxID=300028 RepID=A0A1G8I5G3_9NOCA|nr:GAP family protein [Rhodococcus triatomae]QNG20959.1 hypothetical protein G4H72_21535 [Rhodococcus triatomae]QNG23126.1 hypothetical protein G4H71_08850 [Rhodococcus triatomae]SDI14064.1 Sap, sulfolipid-1-addressing protein [Rhodococcus triatomae]